MVRALLKDLWKFSNIICVFRAHSPPVCIFWIEGGIRIWTPVIWLQQSPHWQTPLPADSNQRKSVSSVPCLCSLETLWQPSLPKKRSVKPKKRNDNTGKVMILLYIWLAINKCQNRQFSDGKLAVLKSRIVVSRQQSYCFWVSVLQRWNPASYFFLRLK